MSRDHGGGSPDLAADWHILDCGNKGAAEALQASYHETVLDNKRFRPKLLADLASILEQEGIELLTFKGWSLAQYYHPPAHRPLGDIDLCVPPGRYAEAADLIAAHSGQARSSSYQLGETWTALILEDFSHGPGGNYRSSVWISPRFRLGAPGRGFRAISAD